MGKPFLSLSSPTALANHGRIQKLGVMAKDLFPKTHSLASDSGSILYTLGFITALMLWAFGLVWLFFAIASILRCKYFPFNIGWWGFTFPIGVYATSTCQMGRELPSEFFDVLGTVCPLPQFGSNFNRLDILPVRGHPVGDCQHWDVQGHRRGQDVLCSLLDGDGSEEERRGDGARYGRYFGG